MAEEHTKMGSMESREGLRTAKLPEFLEAQLVDDILPGEKKYAQKDILLLSPNRDVWLHPEWRVYDEASDEHPVGIEMTDEGYIVDLSGVTNPGWFANTDYEEFEVNGKKPLPILRVIFDVPEPRSS